MAASDPFSALAAIDRTAPDIVITDLFLPDGDGLALTEEIRRRHELCPIIVMAKDAPEPVVVQAFRAGAVDYLQKPVMDDELDRALARAQLLVSGEVTEIPGVQRLEYRLTMAPDLACLPRVIAWLIKTSASMFPEILQLSVRGALQELLFNAVEHGSLELFYENKRKALEEDRYDDLLQQRRSDPRCKDRKVVIHVLRDRDNGVLTYRITDEGNGFDWRRILRRSRDICGEDANGRGIFLVQSLFPSLTYNDRGNEVTFTVPLN